MDFSRQTSISQAKDVQIEDSWIPATPAKPGAPKPQSICKDSQEIQPSEAYLSEFEKFLQEKAAEEAGVLEFERFSSGSSEETEGQVSIWGSSNSSGGKRGFNSMEEAVAANSQLLGDNVGIYKEIPTYVEETMLNNMPFSDLLKLVGNESASVSGSSLVHSSPIDICLSLGSSFQSGMPGTPQCGISFPCEPSFDLNSPAETTAIMRQNISQFAPVTPGIANSSIHEAAKRVEVNEDEQLQLQDDHDPDRVKAQQKPRRKRHRPKVVREGPVKRARKPSTPKAEGPAETPTGKRKYIRKKGLDKPAATPPAEEQNDRANDPKTVGPAEKSCRRSLNFEFESQVRDESSSCKTPSNCDLQSQVRAEKTQVGIAYEFTHSRNQAIEAYPPMLGKQASNPLTPSKTEDAQNSSTRGKCHIVFSNETHDKEASSIQKMVDQNAHSAPRSPTNSKCSGCVNVTGSQYGPLLAHHMFPVNEDNSGKNFGGHFAKTYKRRRTEEGHCSATSSPMSSVTTAQDPVKLLGTTASVMQGPEISHQSRTCIGALSSSLPIWRSMFSLDPCFMQSRHHGISYRSNQDADQEQNALVPYLYHMRYQQQNELMAYNMRYQEANQLVVYQRDGIVVPFEGSSSPVKRRRPRPKVDLDEETTRVWNLLIQDINSEGIDGTEEKAKWWEEERRVFRGRADSFIARMHLIQGDRRFSKWKGSVVDSVVGVFLTQNVSDHLSSSAFMSLAARFPLKSKNNNNPSKEEGTGILIQEPEFSVQESDDSIGWQGEKSNLTGCDKSSMTVQDVEHNEAKEVVSSNESSQNSADSSITQTTEGKETCLQANSEAKLMSGSKPNSFGGSTSFVELLEMAEMPMLRAVYESMTHEFDPQDQYKDRLDGPKASSGSKIRSICNLHLTHNSRYSSNKNLQCASEESELSAESTIQDAVQNINDNSRKTEVKTGQTNLKTLNGMKVNTYDEKSDKTGKEKDNQVDWDSLRKQAEVNGKSKRTVNTMDSLDWEEIRCADVNVIADAIKERGMNNRLAERIKDFLNRLVRDHGSIDLEWLRDIPPDKAKEYLLSIRGLGLKSVECVRLLTLHHLAFPVDTNVGRIAVRLGWVPLRPLPESLQLHLLELYPVLESIQKYLWPRLCKLDQRTLYELHYQMITFGKVFCTKNRPNCNACPLRGECRHFASAFASARLALPAPEEEKGTLSTVKNTAADKSPAEVMGQMQLPPPQANLQLEPHSKIGNCAPVIEEPATPGPIIEEPATPEPIIEEPASPELIQTQILESDIEDRLCEDPEEIPTIRLNIAEFTQNLQNYMEKNMELQEGDMSKALVALTPDAASIPVPKLKNVNQLRTEHQVYELPDSHPLLAGLDTREPDDPCPYLLAIWTPGETAESIQPPDGMCSSQESGKLCDEKTCFSCNNIREANSLTVRGTLLIPCRTANRGSFPLNGTYFQVNEVFADHESSLKPIDVPRAWIWNLPRRTVYFGTSIPTIFKGLSTEGIQYCFWRGFVCVRGFDRKKRAPRPLMARLHFPASKLAKAKGKTSENQGHNEPNMADTRLKFPQVYEKQQQAGIELASNKADLVLGILGSIPNPQ
uniref:DNA demethylase n=2 Tax=Lonicera japonica TaxID=105884 RepID=A0A0U2GNK9_LONJA|nr:DNA demethylase [Lonicera japonica]